MVKHNNLIPNAHFKKDWQLFVRTWLNQPAKKQKRRQLRATRAKKILPRPLDLLRPVVRGRSQKYNTKVRAGRGFTHEELKTAGILRQAALGLGIPVDHRRRNKSDDSHTTNVARLKLYASRLVVYPRTSCYNKNKDKKGDASKDDRKLAVEGIRTKGIIPVTQPVQRSKARKITEEERKSNVAAFLHKARTDAKLWGAREKRAKDKREGKDKKKKKDAAAGGDDTAAMAEDS